MAEYGEWNRKGAVLRPLPVDATRARACAICVASIASDWLPLWTLRVLSGIEVPM
jgi:hypothetical protein